MAWIVSWFCRRWPDKVDYYNSEEEVARFAAAVAALAQRRTRKTTNFVCAHTHR